MKKIYISLPIAIDEATVKERYQEAIDYINNDLREQFEIHGPINIEDFSDNGIVKERDYDYAWYMGEDIKELLRCDAIFMGRGWYKSLGCRCEHETAKVYDKQIIYQLYTYNED